MIKPTRVHICIVCLLIAVSSGLAQKMSIPFYFSAQKIILQYAIKGQSIKLFFDTGWSRDVIDINRANKLNLLPHQKYKQVTQTTINGTVIDTFFPEGSCNYFDSLFFRGYCLSDMKQMRQKLHLDNDIDGIVGFDFKHSKYVMELDFKHNQLCFWDSLPQNFSRDKGVLKVDLLPTDYRNETKTSKFFARYPAMKGSLLVTDTVQLCPLFFFDTGNTAAYLQVVVADSLLFNRMLTYKKKISQKYGNTYPTTHLQLPELGIDSLYVNLSMLPVNNGNSSRMGGKNKVIGFLGMDFFLQYERVLFDCKNKIGYFVEKE
ncbi:hypothetical protein [Paludibacter sp.]|uniref:hypothetical protein n=1 Tax=Paludibacter sp. TaxID=1898105 RepID=UPI001354435F|nr:hypothetical protein [Paludibacter sp.]MTK52907.1 hypothetical protein [Paludibacter sp.]